MARMPGLVVPYYPHHVTQRGNRRQKTFFCEGDYWRAYLSDCVSHDKEELIERHTRTGRPLGNPEFVRKLEILTGKALAPKIPGRKPAISKLVYCPRNPGGVCRRRDAGPAAIDLTIDVSGRRCRVLRWRGMPRPGRGNQPVSSADAPFR